MTKNAKPESIKPKLLMATDKSRAVATTRYDEPAIVIEMVHHDALGTPYWREVTHHLLGHSGGAGDPTALCDLLTNGRVNVHLNVVPVRDTATVLADVHKHEEHTATGQPMPSADAPRTWIEGTTQPLRLEHRSGLLIDLAKLLNDVTHLYVYIAPGDS